VDEPRRGIPRARDPEPVAVDRISGHQITQNRIEMIIEIPVGAQSPAAVLVNKAAIGLAEEVDSVVVHEAAVELDSSPAGSKADV